ncbi:hypothetical protein [Aminobacterium mobile]|jgi:hypothetical protein|uniref:hypothetical protein n=1 Tax=Aminobacterium mobile TaxID=81467 RepID=UPI001B7F9E90|nr:hypothetical protein [Aminobacterium mobile]
MAKKWHPFINHLTCVECGSCIAKGYIRDRKGTFACCEKWDPALSIATAAATIAPLAQLLM